MKNSAFYFHLSLCLVCCFFFFQFEKEFTDHQETQAQLQKKEAEINELQAELQAFKSQVKYYLPGVNLGIENSQGNKGCIMSSQHQNVETLILLVCFHIFVYIYFYSVFKFLKLFCLFFFNLLFLKCLISSLCCILVLFLMSCVCLVIKH